MNVFKSNAAELEKLNDRVKQAFRRRSESPARMAAWHEAAAAFHASYDKLAFPGGLGNELAKLERGDPEAIEMAVQFLEADPWYFRSGYHKADILRLLKNLPLTDDQSARLRTLILQRVRGRAVREVRAYGRLAPRVANAEFEAVLEDIAENSNRLAVRHARHVLDCLRSARGLRRRKRG